MEFANSPRFFRHGPSALARLIVCSSLSIALLVSDSQFGLMERAREGLSVVLYPIQLAVNAPFIAARHVGDFLQSQTALKQQNDELRQDRLKLSARLMHLQAMEKEYLELKAVNALRPSHADDGQITQILYTGRDPFSNKVIIDKGSDDGLASGDPVIDRNGLIGQITRLQPLSAEVTLINDKNQMIPVMVERTQQRTLLYGFGTGIEARYLPLHADIKVGDRFVTSGIDEIYPIGIPVAVVTQVSRNQGASFVKLNCQSLAGVNQSRFVLVLNARAKSTPMNTALASQAEASKPVAEPAKMSE